jgi:hypothetical protein
MIGQLKMPVLVIVGEFDNPEARRTLYQQLGSADKVFIKVACATHFMLWEKQRKVLYDTSIEWMKFGTVQKTARGEFSVDEAGRFAPFR